MHQLSSDVDGSEEQADSDLSAGETFAEERSVKLRDADIPEIQKSHLSQATGDIEKKGSDELGLSEKQSGFVASLTFEKSLNFNMRKRRIASMRHVLCGFCCLGVRVPSSRHFKLESQNFGLRTRILLLILSRKSCT